MSVMKLLSVAVVAASALVVGVPTAADAKDRYGYDRRYERHDRYDRHDRGRYDRVRYDRGRHHRAHKVKVCHREWRHGHRERVCYWTWR